MMDAATIAVYDARAADYARLTADMAEMPQMQAFAALLPEGARVLDLGCGPGQYAEWFARQGFAVDALDASAEMVALAGARPGVSARQARFDDLPARATWHGIWANFSLLHVPRADLPAQLIAIKRALFPGGILHLGMKLGEGEKTDALGRFYAYWSVAELEDLLAETGFAVTACAQGQGEGLSGDVEAHVLMRAHG